MATAKLVQTTTDQTRMGTSQSPMADLRLVQHKGLDVGEEFRRKGSAAYGFGFYLVQPAGARRWFRVFSWLKRYRLRTFA